MAPPVARAPDARQHELRSPPAPESQSVGGGGGVAASPNGSPNETEAPVAPLPSVAEKIPRSTPAAEAPANVDPRFDVRWNSAGFCRGSRAPDIVIRRVALLQTFVVANQRSLVIASDPSIEGEIVDAIERGAVLARPYADFMFGWSGQDNVPMIYVYRDKDQMHSVACVPAWTAGYYDGAIHVSAEGVRGPNARTRDKRFEGSALIVHEYMHHVLQSLGVSKPQWLHEGAAVAASQANPCWSLAKDDPDFRQRMAGQHIAFEAMESAFVDAWDDETEASRAYCQSYLMLEFVVSRRSVKAIARLVDDLSSGVVDARDAFLSASGQSASSLENEWRKFVLSESTAWEQARTEAFRAK